MDTLDMLYKDDYKRKFDKDNPTEQYIKILTEVRSDKSNVSDALILFRCTNDSLSKLMYADNSKKVIDTKVNAILILLGSVNSLTADINLNAAIYRGSRVPVKGYWDNLVDSVFEHHHLVDLFVTEVNNLFGMIGDGVWKESILIEVKKYQDKVR